MSTALQYYFKLIVFFAVSITSSVSYPHASTYKEEFVNKCLNFMYQKHVSGPNNQWDKLSLDYDAVIPRNHFSVIASLSKHSECLISHTQEFDQTNGFLWALAFQNSDNNEQNLKERLNLDIIKEGKIFLLGYLLNKYRNIDKYQEFFDEAMLNLQQLAAKNPDAAFKIYELSFYNLIPATDFVSRDLLKNSTKAFIIDTSSKDLRDKLDDKEFLSGLSQEEASIFRHYACRDELVSYVYHKEINQEGHPECNIFINTPYIQLLSIYPIFDKNYAKTQLYKSQIIEAKNKLFELVESPEKFAHDFPGEQSYEEQAQILLFQLIINFGEDTSIFSQNDIEQYLSLPSKGKVMLSETAIAFYLMGIYWNELSYTFSEKYPQERTKLEEIYKIFSSSKTSVYEDCTKAKTLDFSYHPRWADRPTLPWISSYKIYKIDFIELESEAADQGTLRIEGEWTILDPSFFNLDDYYAEKGCSFDVQISGKPVFPNMLQTKDGVKNFQKGFASSFDSDNSINSPEIIKSSVSLHPAGAIKWYFDINQKIKIESDLSNFPFSIEPINLKFNFITDSALNPSPVLVDADWFFVEPGTLLDENDGNKFSYLETDETLSHLMISAELLVNFKYYTFRVIVPVLIFVALGLFTLLRAREDTEAHLQVATTVMVALVAYQFVINTTLPQLSYLTLIDLFLIFSIVSSAFIILFNLVPHLEKKDSIISRYLFLIARIGGVGTFAAGFGILVYGLTLVKV